MDYKYVSPHCCKCNSFGCTAAIRCGYACHGPHSDRLYSGSEHSQLNSPRLVNREAGFPNPRRALIGSNQLWRVDDSPYYGEFWGLLDLSIQGQIERESKLLPLFLSMSVDSPKAITFILVKPIFCRRELLHTITHHQFMLVLGWMHSFRPLHGPDCSTVSIFYTTALWPECFTVLTICTRQQCWKFAPVCQSESYNFWGGPGSF